MINYTWKIHSLTKRTINNTESVIFTVVWEKFGIDENGYSGSIKTTITFNVNEIDENSFIPYEQLTEEILIDWIRNNINEEAINKGIEAEIEKSKSHWIQINDGEFPWNIIEETLPDPLTEAFSEPNIIPPDDNFDMSIYTAETGIGTTDNTSTGIGTT